MPMMTEIMDYIVLVWGLQEQTGQPAWFNNGRLICVDENLQRALNEYGKSSYKLVAYGGLDESGAGPTRLILERTRQSVVVSQGGS